MQGNFCIIVPMPILEKLNNFHHAGTHTLSGTNQGPDHHCRYSYSFKFIFENLKSYFYHSFYFY